MPKRRKFSASERDLVSRRAHGICEYCRCPEAYTPDTFGMEHIIPLVSEGTNELTNLAFSCEEIEY
jgi:HNH endonuclease